MAYFPHIRMKANDCPMLAFVIPNYSTSFISESFARKANLLGNIDRSNCRSIGGGQLLGWVNDVQVRIDELNLQFVHRFGVMPDKHLVKFCAKKFDMLLGLDLLGGLALGMDYGNLAIIHDNKMAKWLTEEEIEREMEDTY
ncbi:hypothetical protein niasHT_010508 [Heterodera trifolii]|uniref:Uncharacterized protein n=1 Tax=Heterodera trifolii TaxID=157864 RepID=A0ABD2L267_9BILA